MLNAESVLVELGLSPTAARVYLALVALGPASVDAVAQKAGTYKANALSALFKLQEKGLASSVFEGRRRVYHAAPPNRLSDLLEESRRAEQQESRRLAQALSGVLPALVGQFGALAEKDKFEVYRGRQGYKAVVSEIVRTESPAVWKGFGNLQVQEFFPVDFAKWFKKTEFRLFSTPSKKLDALAKAARKTTKVTLKRLPDEVFMPIV
ncbi:MAG: helix-turn-helix domain-containing protein, partial [Candidatus Micrarchaeota archaeon]|nr:helix-turn-helix domain-containing protein [Candidatus Micrarchaeota archaeon]